jgi:hypothetical protein
MSNTPANKEKIKAAAARRKKQADALRSNLKRRKTQPEAKTAPKPASN